MKNKQENKARDERVEKEAILEFIQLGHAHTKEKEAIAKDLGISLNNLRYRVKKFIDGQGIGRKRRNDAGIPKKDPELKVKLEFFAEMAINKLSVDQIGQKLGLTEHQGNMLAQEYKKTDKWKAIRNAPQLETLKDLIQDLFRLDLAIVDSEMHGSFSVQVEDKKTGEKILINIPVEEMKDIQGILAHCIQRDEMGKIDPSYKGISKDELERAKVYYLKEELLEKRNVTEYVRLHKAFKFASPEKQLDLLLVYAIIDRLKPGMDEQEKITIIKEEAVRINL